MAGRGAADGDEYELESVSSRDSRCSWLHQGRVSKKAGFSFSDVRDENGPGPGAYMLPSTFSAALKTHNKASAKRASARLAEQRASRLRKRGKTAPAGGSRGPRPRGQDLPLLPLV